MPATTSLQQGYNFTASGLLKRAEALRFLNKDLIVDSDDLMGSNIFDLMVNGSQLMSKQDVHLMHFEYNDPNYPKPGDGDLTGSASQYVTTTIKSHYITEAKNCSQFMKTAYEDFRLNEQIYNYFSTYLGRYINRAVGALFKSLSLLGDVTTGDGASNLSIALVDEALEKRGDLGFLNPNASMYMNSKTFYDIQKKQTAGTISGDLISQIEYSLQEGNKVYGMASFNNFYYRKSVPVIVDDSIDDGIIALTFNPVFMYKSTDKVIIKGNKLTEGLAVQEFNNPLAEKGLGKDTHFMRMAYILHPIGMKFKGTITTDYASESGPSLTEYRSKPFYELQDTIKSINFLILKVKIG